MPRNLSPVGIVHICPSIGYLFSLERVHKSIRASNIHSSRSWALFLFIDTLILHFCLERIICEMRERETGCIMKMVVFCVLSLCLNQILQFLVGKTVPNVFITISPEPIRTRHRDYTQQVNIGKDKKWHHCLVDAEIPIWYFSILKHLTTVY